LGWANDYLAYCKVIIGYKQRSRRLANSLAAINQQTDFRKGKAKQMLKIIIAENNAAVSKGVKRILLKEYQDAVIDEVVNGRQLLQTIAENRYSLVIADVLIPGIKITEAIKQMKTIYPLLPVLILSMYPLDHYGISILKAGATGFLITSLVPEKLVSAVHTVLKGKTFPSRQSLMSWH